MEHNSGDHLLQMPVDLNGSNYIVNTHANFQPHTNGTVEIIRNDWEWIEFPDQPHLVWLLVLLKLIKKRNVISNHQPLCFRLSIKMRGDRLKTTGPPANKESSKVGGTQSLLDEMKNRPPQRGKGDDKDKVDEDTKKSNLNLLLSEMVKKYTSQHAKTKRKSRPMSDGIIGQVDELETLVRA